MPEPNQQSDIPFGQYGALLLRIETQQKQIDRMQNQLERTLDEHEKRLNKGEERAERIEKFFIIGLFVFALAIVIAYFVIRETVLRG